MSKIAKRNLDAHHVAVFFHGANRYNYRVYDTRKGVDAAPLFSTSCVGKLEEALSHAEEQLRLWLEKKVQS